MNRNRENHVFQKTFQTDGRTNIWNYRSALLLKLNYGTRAGLLQNDQFIPVKLIKLIHTKPIENPICEI